MNNEHSIFFLASLIINNYETVDIKKSTIQNVDFLRCGGRGESGFSGLSQMQMDTLRVSVAQK